MKHKLHVSGGGPWAAYYEKGLLVDGTEEACIQRRPTMRAAKIAALETAKALNLPHVYVGKIGFYKWCTCGKCFSR